MQHLPRCPHQLVDRFDHVNRNTNGPRLVSNRARNRLTDPPGRIGRELVPTAIFKLINRFHQADIAFLNKIKELQATVGVFLRNGNHEAKVCLNHLLLGDARFALTLLYRVHNAAIFSNVETGFLSKLLDLVANFFDRLFVVLRKVSPAFAFQAANSAHPIRVELVLIILLQEVFPRHTMRFSSAHQTTLKAH